MTAIEVERTEDSVLEGWVGFAGRRWRETIDVRDFIQRKAVPRIFNPAHHHMTRAHVRNLDMLTWIELSAMSNRIQQHFPECQADLLLFLLRQIRHFVDKLNQAICRSKVATGGQDNPGWRRGNQFNALVPDRSFRSQPQHLGKNFLGIRL